MQDPKTPVNSLGKILTLTRLIPGDGVPLFFVARNLDIPEWYLQGLEEDKLPRPGLDRFAMILLTYGLTLDLLDDYQMDPDLTTTLFKFGLRRNKELRNTDLGDVIDWPDTTAFAETYGIVSMTDKTDRNSYADILRCLRQEFDATSIPTASRRYGVAPIIYWQIEAARIPTPAKIIAALKERLHVDDLTPFLTTSDLYQAISQQLAGNQENLPTSQS
ncbi:hypothetical protein [Levilactobacillus lindianensis]|uniref:hypothetical protein n=1 Tax=Levilactobacillus lindianensis TaxID=2486018 RepID=UPI0013DE6495|nr:hypothetical protein [Levilactobacillus lindianensis]